MADVYILYLYLYVQHPSWKTQPWAGLYQKFGLQHSVSDPAAFIINVIIMQQSGREGHPISSVSKELFRNEAVGWWWSSAFRPVRSFIVPHDERSSVPPLPLFYSPL